jgi:hypothetical protein
MDRKFPSRHKVKKTRLSESIAPLSLCRFNAPRRTLGYIYNEEAATTAAATSIHNTDKAHPKHHSGET